MNGYVGGELNSGAAWNPLSKTVAGAFQDNGDAFQTLRGSLAWQQLLGADGTNVAFNATTLRGQNQVLFYGTTQNLGIFQRFTLDASNAVIGPAVVLNPQVGGQPVRATFSAKVRLNVQDPTLIAIGGARVYVGRDDITNPGATPSTDFPGALNVNLPVTDVAGTNVLSNDPGVTALAFGTREASWKYALLAADYVRGGIVYLSPNITAPGAHGRSAQRRCRQWCRSLASPALACQRGLLWDDDGTDGADRQRCDSRRRCRCGSRHRGVGTRRRRVWQCS